MLCIKSGPNNNIQEDDFKNNSEIEQRGGDAMTV